MLRPIRPSLFRTSRENRLSTARLFLTDNLVYPGAQFDVVLFWNLADYMDESLVKAGHWASLVFDSARWRLARLLPHPRSRPGIAMLPLPHGQEDTLEMQLM